VRTVIDHRTSRASSDRSSANTSASVPALAMPMPTWGRAVAAASPISTTPIDHALDHEVVDGGKPRFGNAVQYCEHRRRQETAGIFFQLLDEVLAHLGRRDAHAMARPLSAQHRKPALLRERVERSLHHRTHMSIDLVNVRIIAELGGNVDWFEHLSGDLRRQG
jgi:hypothetical protein